MWFGLHGAGRLDVEWGFVFPLAVIVKVLAPLLTLKSISHHESTLKASTLELKDLFWLIRSFSEVSLSAWALAGLL